MKKIITALCKDVRDLGGNDTYHVTKKENNKDVNSPQNKSINLRQFK